MSGMTERIHTVTHEISPAEEIHQDIGMCLDKIEPTGTDLLVAIYVRPTLKTIKGAGGILVQIDISPSGSVREDKYQGKVCLVLKCGPNISDAGKYFKGCEPPKPGDWVLIFPMKRDQFLMGVEDKTRHVAFVAAHNVSAILTDPDYFL